MYVFQPIPITDNHLFTPECVHAVLFVISWSFYYPSNKYRASLFLSSSFAFLSFHLVSFPVSSSFCLHILLSLPLLSRLPLPHFSSLFLSSSPRFISSLFHLLTFSDLVLPSSLPAHVFINISPEYFLISIHFECVIQTKGNDTWNNIPNVFLYSYLSGISMWHSRQTKDLTDWLRSRCFQEHITSLKPHRQKRRDAAVVGDGGKTRYRSGFGKRNSFSHTDQQQKSSTDIWARHGLKGKCRTVEEDQKYC